MTERERLKKFVFCFMENCTDKLLYGGDFDDVFTDYLLDNGVIVPQCKVGDKVWLTLELLKGGLELVESRCVKITIISDRQIVYSMHINDRAIGNTLEFYDDEFGKTVFLSREEAEKSIKGV